MKLLSNKNKGYVIWQFSKYGLIHPAPHPLESLSATKKPIKFASIIKPNNLSESGPKLNKKHTNRMNF